MSGSIAFYHLLNPDAEIKNIMYTFRYSQTLIEYISQINLNKGSFNLHLLDFLWEGSYTFDIIANNIQNVIVRHKEVDFRNLNIAFLNIQQVCSSFFVGICQNIISVQFSKIWCQSIVNLVIFVFNIYSYSLLDACLFLLEPIVNETKAVPL